MIAGINQRGGLAQHLGQGAGGVATTGTPACMACRGGNRTLRRGRGRPTRWPARAARPGRAASPSPSGRSCPGPSRRRWRQPRPALPNRAVRPGQGPHRAAGRRWRQRRAPVPVDPCAARLCRWRDRTAEPCRQEATQHRRGIGLGGDGQRRDTGIDDGDGVGSAPNASWTSLATKASPYRPRRPGREPGGSNPVGERRLVAQLRVVQGGEVVHGDHRRGATRRRHKKFVPCTTSVAPANHSTGGPSRRPTMRAAAGPAWAAGVR